jgi:hypothetical protein
MASFSNTELNASVRELWDEEIEEARYASASLMPRISNKSGTAKKKGDIINVTVDQKWTVGDVGSNGAFVPQTYTSTAVAITVNQHKQVAVEVEDRTEAQSFWSPISTFRTTAGKAFAASYDSAIGALHGDLTLSAVGTGADPVAMGKAQAQLALLRAADANLPETDLSFFLPPIAFYNGLLNEVQLTDASATGMAKSPLITGEKFPILGVRAFMSTNLTTSGSAIKGMLVHKSAFAIAFQKNNEYKSAERTASLVLSEVAVITSLYGVRTIRGDHGVVINIQNS